MEFVPEELIKISLALIVGAIIGAEREYRSKVAGFRTVMLITVGSAVFTILSAAISPHDPDRIAANIVTGIGFLGAGAILRENDRISGITTAACIWTSAALGMSIGSGHYILAAGGTVLVIIILYFMGTVERVIDRRSRTRKYKIVFKYHQKSLQHYEQLFEETGLRYERMLQSKIEDEIVGNWLLTGTQSNHEKLISRLLADPELKEFDF